MRILRPVVYFLLALAALVAMNAPFWPPYLMDIAREAKNTNEFRNRIDQEKPEIVLVGNSLLGEGVHPDKLAELTGLPTFRWAHGGSASAFWYLAIKNHILKAHHKPYAIAIFFRDNFLTFPEFRVRSHYQKNIERLATDHEPELDRLAYLGGLSSIEYHLSHWSPLFQNHDTFKWGIEAWVKAASASWLFDLNAGQADAAIKRQFSVGNLNEDFLTKQQLEAEAWRDEDGNRYATFDFWKKVDTSFLPSLIRLSQDAGVKLILVRLKRVRDCKPNQEPPELVQYIKDLRVYLKQQGVPFIDYTHDGRLEFEDFGAGDHLNRYVAMDRFTQMVAEDICNAL